MGKNPAMQLYVNDWLSSPTVMTMTPLQELAYFRMLLFCWASGDCSITADPETLAMLTRTDANTCSTVVERAFNEHPNDRSKLTNNRLYSLWEERLEFNRQRSEAGKKSGKARRAKSNSATSKSKRTSVEQALNEKAQPVAVSLNSSSSSLSPSSSKKNNPPVAQPRGNGVGVVDLLVGLGEDERIEAETLARRIALVVPIRDNRDAQDFVCEAAIRCIRGDLARDDIESALESMRATNPEKPLAYFKKCIRNATA